jgi:hypothetical protein
MQKFVNQTALRPQQRDVHKCILCERIPSALIVLALLGGVATWGFGVAYAQGPTFPLYISPEFEPLEVEVLPLPPDQDDAALTESPPLQAIPDPRIQTGELNVFNETIGLISEPLVNMNGLTAAGDAVDPVLDVGRNHIVQMVNLGAGTVFQIWNKDGTALRPCPACEPGPRRFSSLWPAKGFTCGQKIGLDPIVVYDHLNDRWLLTQPVGHATFRPRGEVENVDVSDRMCIAISKTPDPTAGKWVLYTFELSGANPTKIFPDYPKFGVWPNGYYMSSWEKPPGSVCQETTFTCELAIYVFDRARMLLGGKAGFMKYTIPALGAPGVRDTRILPSDLDGPPPPGGNPPNYFVRTVEHDQDPSNPFDRIEVYEALPDWTRKTFSLTLVNTLRPEPFQIMRCNRRGQGPALSLRQSRDCIPQPTVENNLDAHSFHPMMQLKYRNFGSFQAMVFNQTIDVRGSISGFAPVKEVAGIRWYELRKSGADWRIHQQGTFAPQPPNVTNENQLLHRWMGSAAMDKDGNIALGYSITNSDATPTNRVFPGIRYTGRQVNDSLNSLPQGENVILNGSNAQSPVFGRRWGDYSALSVDPVDDCTFWYTTHVAGISTVNIPTQIASFRFDTCDGPRASPRPVPSPPQPVQP